MWPVPCAAASPFPFLFFFSLFPLVPFLLASALLTWNHSALQSESAGLYYVQAKLILMSNQ